MSDIGADFLGRDTPRFLRGAGLICLATGWFTLLATLSARVAGARFALGDIELIACLVVALCIVGATMLLLDALRTGFGALDTFFSEALARSARRTPVAPKIEPEPIPSPQAPTPEPTRGYIGDRPYILDGDGAVTVETLLGPRRFGSLREAEEFVGA